MRAVVLYEHGGMANFIYEENYRDPECGSDDVIVAVNSHLSNQKLCIFCIISRYLSSSHYDFLPTWLYR